jgi:DNA-binding CsgD family transcriptional regulator
MHVSLGALQQALQLVDGLAEVDDPADFGERALPGVAQLVGCDHLSYSQIGPSPGQMSSCGHPAGLATPASLAVFTAHLHQHPLVNYYRATGDGSPVKISDFLSRERFHRLGLYAEFFRHFPVEHQLAVSLPSPGAQVVGIALNRHRGDFTEPERDLLGVLRAPLLTALARARARHRARRAMTAASDSNLSGLTDRELQVLDLVALGRTNGAIARVLHVSPRTVAKHLEHIYRKLDVTSRAAAAYHATRRSAQASPAPPRRERPVAG